MAINDATSSTSYFQKTVTLRDWWLTKPKPDDVTNKTIGVAGIVSSHNNWAERCFSTAPILKENGIVELETVDGVCVILQGFINKERTLENGFSSEVFKHFVFGFPVYWENFATSFPEEGSADKCVSHAHEDEKDSFEGHADILDNLSGNPQDFDSCYVDMGLPEAEDTGLSNKTSGVPNASSNDIPHEHVIESGHEVLIEKSPVRSEFKDDLSLSTGPSSMDVRGMKHNVARNVTVSSTTSKCSAVSSSRRLTRSMSKTGKVTLIDLDNLGGSDILKGKRSALSNKKTVNVRVMGESRGILSTSVGNRDEQNANNIYSNVSAVHGKESNAENIIKLKRKSKQNDPDVKVTRKKLSFEVDISNQGISEVHDVRSESQVGTRKSDIEASLSETKSSDSLSGRKVGVESLESASPARFNFTCSVVAQNDNTVSRRTNMKTRQDKKKNKGITGSPLREGTCNAAAAASHGIEVGTSNQGINENADVCGESQACTSKSDIGAHHSKANCSDPLSGRSVGVECSVSTSTEKFYFASGVTDPNENTVVSKTNMETRQNKKKNN
ncbi:kinetochore-associated protein KNL-2 homolog isoform X1, partial [Tanacetum coccineum]